VRPESFNLATYLKPDKGDALIQIEEDRKDLLAERQKHFSRITEINNQVCEMLGLKSDQQSAVRIRFLRLTREIRHKIIKAEQLKLADSPVVDSFARIERAARVARHLLARKLKVESLLLKSAKDANYEAIYKAIQHLSQIECSDICPACSTPLKHVVENPFEKAKRELQTLGRLEDLRKANQRNDEHILQIVREIANGLAGVEKNSRLGIHCRLSLENLKMQLANFEASTNRVAPAVSVLSHFASLFRDENADIKSYLLVCKEKSDAVAQAAEKVSNLGRAVEALQKSKMQLKICLVIKIITKI
jgi:DNA sulfur modification protein DndD